MRVDHLLRERTVFSFEFFPPKTEAARAQLHAAMAELATLRPDFVSVTYGAGGSTRDLTVDLVREIAELGLNPMAHLTCVGHTAEELAQTLDQLAAIPTANVLALRGDPPKGQTDFQRPEGGFGYAQELVRFVKGRYDFCVGGACYPEKHPESPNAEEDLDRLKEKVDAGAGFLVTQLFFEPDLYFAFRERAERKGIRVPIVPGVMPLTNAHQLDRFVSAIHASVPAALRARLPQGVSEYDATQIGVEWATRQCETLLAGGAPGVHFYTLNRSHATQDIFRNLMPERAIP